MKRSQLKRRASSKRKSRNVPRAMGFRRREANCWKMQRSENPRGSQ